MKRGLIQFIFIFMIFIFFADFVSALTVMPAKVEANFVPGFETEVTYTVLHNNPSTEFELYIAGNLSDYVQLNKNKLVGGGTFTASVNLPLIIEKPGKHRILIGVKEVVNEKDMEISRATIGTSVTIQAVIDVYVPYPGKYFEIFLSSNNVNLGEPVEFNLEIVSQGKEDVNLTPRIDIFSNEQLIETLLFFEREIKSMEKVKLRKFLDTTNYAPGPYNALAIIDYGKVVVSNSFFNIGDLVIHLLNYTNQLEIGGLNRFDIEIESGWNDPIDGAYAEVFFINDSGFNSASFKTSSTGLAPWERTTITGYFDTSNFTEGVHDANITFVYYGKNVGKISSELVKVTFVKKTDYLNLVLIIAGIVLALVIFIVLIKKYFLKNGKNK
jgi:hypothetical protein